MPIRKDLLEILCCPVTKQPVEILSTEKLSELNEQISQGHIKDAGGNQVEDAVEEALVTADGKTIYRIDNDIPIMLAEQGIPTEQIEGF
ncbi:MAG: Trm112 family protein [Candidatus Krumholzibacteriia bacterium]